MEKHKSIQIEKSEVFSIKQALAHLNISRASLYNYINKIGIIPIKKGQRVYLLEKDINSISLAYKQKNNCLDNQEASKNNLNSESLSPKITKAEKSLKKERLKNTRLLEKIEKLNREVGQWEGTAKTLLDQNQKLIQNNNFHKKSFFQRLFNL